MARKWVGEVSLHNHEDLLDCRDLWKAPSDVTALFAIVENIYKTFTHPPTTKIDCEKMVSNLIKNQTTF